MITKAQLDAALSRLEKKLESRMDTRLDLLREKVLFSEAAEVSKHEFLQEESWQELESALAEIRQGCADDRQELQAVRARLARLEEMIAALASPGGTGETGIEIIKDDLSI